MGISAKFTKPQRPSEPRHHFAQTSLHFVIETDGRGLDRRVPKSRASRTSAAAAAFVSAVQERRRRRRRRAGLRLKVSCVPTSNA